MRQDITFLSDGRKLVGHVYLPDDRSADQQRPAVVVVGASSGTKEQTPAEYSQRLVRLGYVALAFDHTTYGESDGTPRSDENPFAKSEDIKNAVTFLTSRERSTEAGSRPWASAVAAASRPTRPSRTGGSRRWPPSADYRTCAVPSPTGSPVTGTT